MRKILVVEDESAIREFIVINLNRSGYEVVEASSGEQAIEIYKSEGTNIDIVLLDVMMPGIDGFTVCKELRKQSKTVGIVMLTAKTQEMDKVGGLMLGADDYITKPFSPSELVARIDAVYRRIALTEMRNDNNFKDEIISGEFSLSLRSRVLKKNDVVVELTQIEFQIMEYLFSNPGIALSRTDILSHVWGESYVGEEKIVDVNIRRLRMKIEEKPSTPKHLVTVWGIGYKWNSVKN